MALPGSSSAGAGQAGDVPPLSAAAAASAAVAVHPSGGPPRRASMFACVTTLSNTLLGVSVVGVAGGFARAGCAVGTLYLCLFAGLAGSGLHLLARSSMTVSAAARRQMEEEAMEGGGAGKVALPPSSFRSVALVGAPRWAFLIDIAVALKCFGVATSYLVVIGDLMPAAMSDIVGDAHPDSLLLERRLWVTVGFFLAAPLAFSRTLGALKYTATLAIGLVIFLSGMVISFWLLPGLDACPDAEDPSSSALSFDAATDDLGTDGVSPTEAAAADFSSRGLAASVPPVEMDEGRGGGGFGRAKGFEDGEQSGGDCFEGSNAIGSIRNILQTLPIFVFSFTCHQNIFTICNEIDRPTPARVDTVIVCAMLVATATYSSLSWGAYATFGVGVEGDLLEAYPRTGLLTIARICVSMLVTSCYPLQAHPSRLCVLSTWKAFEGDMDKAYSALVSDDDCNGNGVTAIPKSTGETVSPPTGTNGYAAVPVQDDVVANNKPSVLTNHRSRNLSSPSDSNSISSSGSPPRQGSGSTERGRKRGGRRNAAGVPGRLMGADSPGREGFVPGPSSSRVEPLDGSAPTVADHSSSAESDNSAQGEGGFVYPQGENEAVFDDSERGGSLLGTARGSVQKNGEKEDQCFWTTPEGFRHILVTGVFLGLSYAIAMAVDDLGVLLEVVGATGSTTIAFILPGLLYLKVHPEPHPKRSLAALQLAAGLLIIPVALTFIALGDSPERRR